MILIEPPRSTIAARRDPLNRRELARFAALAVEAAGARGSISVLLTDDERLRELNRQFRRKNKPTDVLSFPPLEDVIPGSGRRRAGDLAISLDTAARQAEAFGHSLADEVRVLILHGALHLAGYDHEADNGEMARLEQRLRKRFGLPAGLIDRVQRAAAPTGRPRKAATSVGNGRAGLPKGPVKDPAKRRRA